MPVARTSRCADRQSKHPGIPPIGFVEKSLAAQFALRCFFAYVFIHYLSRIAEPHGAEVQVLSISADHHCIQAHLLDAVGAMGEGKLLQIAIGPTHGIENRALCFLRISPATAGTVKKVVAYKVVL